MDCAVMVRDESESELVHLVQHHARETHDMEMSEDQVRELASDV